MKGNVLFIATVDVHIWAFHMPYLKMLRDMGYEVEVAAGPSGFADKIRAQGYRVHTIPFSRNPLSFKNVVAYNALCRLMRDRRYVLVHVHTPVAGFLGRLAAKREHVPHVLYTAHGFHFHRYGKWWSNCLYYTLEWMAARWTDVLITINEEDFAVASSRFAHDRTRVVHVPGVGVDQQRFRIPTTSERSRVRSSLGVAEESFLIIWVGEFNQNKHPEDALALFSSLAGRVSVQMVMLGDGKGVEEARDLAMRYGIDRNVVFPGRVDNVVEYLSAGDVLISTSMREGLPRNVMEAMATGLSVVAYDIRGCNDLVIDEQTGFLIPFGDTGTFAGKLEWLAQHPGERSHMGKAGRKRIEQIFSLDAVLPKMKEIYENELECRGAR